MAGSGTAPQEELPPEFLFSNLILYNPFTCSWEHTSFTVGKGIVLEMGVTGGGRECDLGGALVIPGLIDAHVHIESSLLAPTEFGRLVLSHGITTVVADPHEIANVLGVAGIAYMLEEEKRTPLDIFFMLPSCVPASPDDAGGAVITAEDLSLFLNEGKVLGLGEVMDVESVLSGDQEVQKKLRLTSLIDGHAPLLRGRDLDRYLRAGIESDHECTQREEAWEKVRKGMFIMIREGSTERNLRDLLPLVTPCSLSRWSFATDDRHADMLAREGSIDDCIRKALQEGMDLELALRMATLSPCDRFQLRDRGALAPGKVADFCILRKDEPFLVSRVFKGGREVSHLPFRKPTPVPHLFQGTIPEERELRITGAGKARIIRLVEGQILTRGEILPVDGKGIPDRERDILKVVVCSRYRPGHFAVGLVQGFGLREGALATSVAHDSHNLVAVGTDDSSLRKALKAVLSRNGGMAAVRDDKVFLLPLECAGLMSGERYERVVEKLRLLEVQTHRMGCLTQPFMYLSFLTLTVVPELRLTEAGLFDVAARTRVSLFLIHQE
jgi:adenine deaminase